MSGQLCERIRGLFGNEEASDCVILFYLSPNEPRGGDDDRDGEKDCDRDVHGASGGGGGDGGGGGADTTVGDNARNRVDKGGAVAVTPPPPSPSAVRFVGSPLPAHSLVLWAASERFRAQLDRWRHGGWGHDDGCRCYCSPLGARGEVTSAMRRSEARALESYGLGQQQQRKRERQQCEQRLRELPPPSPPWSQCHRIELRVPLGSEKDRFGALAALQYMYTGDLPGPAINVDGGGAVSGTDPLFSVTDLLAVRSQATYLQVNGCAEACDRALLQILRADDATQQAAAEGPGGKAVLCGLRGQGSSSGISSYVSISTAGNAAAKQLHGLGDAAGGISGGSGCGGRKPPMGAGSRNGGGGGGGGGGSRADADASPVTLRDGVVAILQFAEQCPAAASDASFLPVVDACRRHLVSYLPDALVVLNSPSLRQQFVELPVCALEILLGCSGLRTDNEASVLQLLAVWLAANPDTSPARCTALCCRIRAAHMGRAYLAFVLPYVAWWPLGYRQQLRALHLASATAAERRALSELEVTSRASDDGVDAWCSAPPREPSDNVVVFRWNVPRKALLQAILTSGDAAVTFDGGAEAVSMGGFEWRVFVKPPRSAGGGGGSSGFGNGGGSGNDSGGDGSSGAPTAAVGAGVYLICKLPAEVEFGYRNSGTSSREAGHHAAAIGGSSSGAGDGGDGRPITGITSISSGIIEIFHGRLLTSAPLTQTAPNRRLGDSQQLAGKFYGGAASFRPPSQTWASMVSRPASLMSAAAAAPTPLPRQPHHPNGGDDGGDDVAAVVRFGSHEVFKFGSGAPGRGICDVLPLRATGRKSAAAVDTTMSVAATMAPSATAATAATASESVLPMDADDLLGDLLAPWLPYLQPQEVSGSGGATAAAGGGLAGTLTLRTR